MKKLLNREKILNIKYASLQFLFWGSYCLDISFISTYCTHLGYTSGEVGLIVGFAYVLSIPVQQLAAGLLDKFRRFTTNQCLVIMTLVKIALMTVAFVIDSKTLAYSLLRLCVAAVCMGFEPILSAYAGIFSYNDLQVSYSFGRGMGSFGYAVVASLSGRLFSVQPKSVYLIFFTLSFLNLLAVYWISREKFEDVRVKKTEKKEEEDGSFLREVLRNKTLLAVLFASLFAIGANCSYSTFLVQLVYDNGGTSANYGNLTAFAAMAEIISFVFFDKLREHFKVTDLLKFSICFFALKHIILLFSGNLLTMYLAMLCQPLGFALMTCCLVQLVLDIVALKHINKGQALLGAFQRVGSVMGTITCGLLAEAYSIRFTFGVISCFGLAAVLIVWIFVKQGSHRPMMDRNML